MIDDDDDLARRVIGEPAEQRYAWTSMRSEACNWTSRGLPARRRDLVNYGRISDAFCTVQPDAFIFRNLTMRGFWLVNWYRQWPEGERAVRLAEIANLIAKGKLHAPIDATDDVSDIKEAVAVAASGGRSGKVSSLHATDPVHRRSPGRASCNAP